MHYNDGLKKLDKKMEGKVSEISQNEKKYACEKKIPKNKFRSFSASEKAVIVLELIKEETNTRSISFKVWNQFQDNSELEETVYKHRVILTLCL